MQASPATEQRCFRWSVPGKPVIVDLPLSLVEALAADVRAGLETTGRGLEVGGLLLGRTRREGGRTLAIVEDFEPVDCEHVAGPSYMLSSADRRSLEARIRRRKGAVIGFYRSNTRKEFAVTVEDVALMGWYFSHPADTFLLIDAPRNEPLRAAFVLWDGRAMAQKTADDEFPLDAAALTGRSHMENQRPLPPKPVRVVKRGWFAAAAVILAFAAALVVDRSERIAPQAQPRPQSVPITRIPSAEPPRAPEPVAAAEPSPLPDESAAPSPPPIPVAAPPKARTRAVQAADRRILEPPPNRLRVEAPPADVVEAPAIDLPAGPSVSLPLLSVPAAPPPSANSAVSVSMNVVTRGGSKFVPPAAIREVRPEVPPSLQVRLKRDVQMVRVKVYLDRAGNVQYAELLSDGLGENRELASLAVFAARRWQFTPASRDGKPVEAQAVLRFRFGPGAE